MTVLIVTTMMPGARVTGSEVVSSTFIEAIRQTGRRVVVVAYRRVGSPLEVGPDDVRVADRHIETKGAGLRPYVWMARALATRSPYSSAKYITRRYREEVGSAVRGLRPELVVLDHAQMAWALPENLDSRLIYLAHNVEHQLYGEAARGSRWPLSWVNRREANTIELVERALARRATEAWTLSQRDADSIQGLNPGAATRVFEMPPTLPWLDVRETTYDVATIGSWTWSANAAGLRWFLDEVVSRMPAEARIGVAGAGAESIVADRPNVSYEGRVPDAARFLAKSRVVAVPSVAGAGVQIKSVDAIGTGKPVVATPFALRGIDSLPATVRSAEGPGDFAAAVQDQLREPLTTSDRESAADWVKARRGTFQDAIASAIDASHQAIPA